MELICYWSETTAMPCLPWVSKSHRTAQYPTELTDGILISQGKECGGHNALSQIHHRDGPLFSGFRCPVTQIRGPAEHCSQSPRHSCRVSLVAQCSLHLLFRCGARCSQLGAPCHQKDWWHLPQPASSNSFRLQEGYQLGVYTGAGMENIGDHSAVKAAISRSSPVLDSLSLWSHHHCNGIWWVISRCCCRRNCTRLPGLPEFQDDRIRTNRGKDFWVSPCPASSDISISCGGPGFLLHLPSLLSPVACILIPTTRYAIQLCHREA